MVGGAERRADTLKAAGADAVLIDPQFSRFLRANANVDPYLDALRLVAAAHQVPLLRRWDLMRYWVETEQVDVERAPKPDRVAATDRLNDCLAQADARRCCATARRRRGGGRGRDRLQYPGKRGSPPRASRGDAYTIRMRPPVILAPAPRLEWGRLGKDRMPDDPGNTASFGAPPLLALQADGRPGAARGPKARIGCSTSARSRPAACCATLRLQRAERRRAAGRCADGAVRGGRATRSCGSSRRPPSTDIGRAVRAGRARCGADRDHARAARGAADPASRAGRRRWQRHSRCPTRWC